MSAAAIGFALVIAGCASEDRPVRVAVLTECAGPLQAAEETIVAAAQLPFVQRGAERGSEDPTDGTVSWEVGDRRVEIQPACTVISEIVRLIVEVRRLVEDEDVRGDHRPSRRD